MSHELTPEQRETLANALYGGQKISAIKQLREITGLDLKDAKGVIDQMEVELRAAHPERFASAPKKSSCLLLVVVLIHLSFVLGFLLWRHH
jgi:ribosomal protein L7/L12